MMSAEGDVIVETSCGSLRGKNKTSSRKGNYFSFQGIPYAQPPVGDLRFKAPLPAKVWSGVRDAFTEGPIAPGVGLFRKDDSEKQSEDCLYLNVYTPKVPENKTEPLMAVMFWIHGGGFNAGSGNSDLYGPDYLVAENIVLVTTNYRLGALGFLSLETPQCSGNNGLKDIIQALKWCQENISNFGGNPNNVTIFGESAGGAAVHYLALSKAAEGLFHKAIAQSGVAQNPWAFSRKPREAAFKLGEALGCKTDSDDELMKFLRTVQPEDLVKKGNRVLKVIEPNEHFTENAFGPCVEPEGVKGAVLTMHPDDLYGKENLRFVPFMIGVTTMEGLIMIALKGEMSIDQINLSRDLKKLLPKNWNVDHESKKGEEILKKIENFYFPNGYDQKNYVDALSRIYFLNGINQVISYHQNCLTNPTYVYRFSYEGEALTVKLFLGHNHLKGTCHGDDLSYLFKQNMFDSSIPPNTKDYAMMETMTKMWADFAKNGKPLPESTWPPISKTDLPYLDIGQTLTKKFDLEKEEFEFWKSLYNLASQNQLNCRL